MGDGVTKVLVLLFFVGCDGDARSTLLVDLRTDYVAGVEVAAARTSLADESGATVSPTRVTDISPVRDLLAGLRIAEFEGLGAGNYTVTVALEAPDGALVAQRVARVELRENIGITTVMTRSCTGLACPAAADEASAISCVGARCVDPRCLPEQPETCPPPSCRLDTDCPSGAPCAAARCSDGVCLLVSQSSACSGDEYCSPERGCLPVAPPDASTPDTSTGDTGPADAAVDAPTTSCASARDVTGMTGTFAEDTCSYSDTSAGDCSEAGAPEIFLELDIAPMQTCRINFDPSTVAVHVGFDDACEERGRTCLFTGTFGFGGGTTGGRQYLMIERVGGCGPVEVDFEECVAF